MNNIKKLNQQNNLLDEKILPENQEIFTNMICYLRGSNISEYEIEVVRQDLTEMVLSAQSRGESISTLFSGDYKQFCDEVIENLPPKSRKQKVMYGVNVICWGLSILFAINIIVSKDTIAIIEAIINKNPVNWNISVSVASMIYVLVIIALANIIVNVIMKNAFAKEVKHKKILTFAGGAGFMLILVIIAWIGNSTLFTINIFLACVAAFVLYVAHKILESVNC